MVAESHLLSFELPSYSNFENVACPVLTILVKHKKENIF